MSTTYRVHVFGKSGCDKCTVTANNHQCMDGRILMCLEPISQRIAVDLQDCIGFCSSPIT